MFALVAALAFNAAATYRLQQRVTVLEAQNVKLNQALQLTIRGDLKMSLIVDELIKAIYGEPKEQSNDRDLEVPLRQEQGRPRPLDSL